MIAAISMMLAAIAAPAQVFRSLLGFDNADGAYPYAGLVQGIDGNLYGTSQEGGTQSDGTVFKITSDDALTTLYSFCFSDGFTPEAPLIQGSDGNLYGTTVAGGTGPKCSAGFADGCGTVFKIVPGGARTTLHNFENTDGEIVYGGLVQATSGTYGIPFGGGLDGYGTIFSEAVGLGPFVTTLPTSRKVGQRVAILGNNLTGATSASFNGTAARFTVVSSSEITTTVLNGATTGKVQVTKPTGTLSSNVPFRVRT
ncbi:MAG TPA: choice-of-anchor tandem repeat GloVer-containing protein [Terriglobia bacterium]|nr:choice-of-anchor tandem repeat GloVer-containing protein [Terriglobia bacterium]